MGITPLHLAEGRVREQRRVIQMSVSFNDMPTILEQADQLTEAVAAYRAAQVAAGRQELERLAEAVFLASNEDEEETWDSADQDYFFRVAKNLQLRDIFTMREDPEA